MGGELSPGPWRGSAGCSTYGVKKLKPWVASVSGSVCQSVRPPHPGSIKQPKGGSLYAPNGRNGSCCSAVAPAVVGELEPSVATAPIPASIEGGLEPEDEFEAAPYASSIAVAACMVIVRVSAARTPISSKGIGIWAPEFEPPLDQSFRTVFHTATPHCQLHELWGGVLV